MIGRETIERIREQTSILELIGETVGLRPHGRSYVGRCPFHKESTPSFHVNPERGFYHCSGCGEFGDAFKFVQQTESLSFTEAARRLAERAGIALEDTPEEAVRSDLRREILLTNLNEPRAETNRFSSNIRLHKKSGFAYTRRLRMADRLFVFRVQGPVLRKQEALGLKFKIRF